MPGVDLKLNPEPDGYGFLYGTLSDGDETHRVDVLPPVTHWCGHIKLPNYEPHATDWIVYVNGEEIAHVSRREDLGAMVRQRLLTRYT
jgi:hypothetical protein